MTIFFEMRGWFHESLMIQVPFKGIKEFRNLYWKENKDDC